ncbi:EAL domain-containing protein [Sphingobium sp. BHU LFT2]|uniref:bifunctional diguanylate cyclase/phosphodiesterase n=1 Tax=Sphingobium sp. BHU LFT2 TaxID=2807634 RepID=UPI001BEB930B|nr:EAL domain-containing protein [Sphingobium sp. BHU LFT2]MBT2245439.1 EAL domain-containing protein [Sphingobium sp. BHU LFT2]
MFDIYFCIRDDHDLRLVAAAGLICAISAIAIVLFLRRARDTKNIDHIRWAIASGGVGGFGVWSTHFTAMMGYDPGIILGYALVPTILSLLTVVSALTLAHMIALRSSALNARILAGLVVALGIASMHYLGIYAIRIDADFRWSQPMVIASILLITAPAPLAFHFALDRRGYATGVLAALSILTGILSLHFAGMAALSLRPNRLEETGGLLLSTPQMGLAVAIVALGVLTVSIMAALSSARLHAAVGASEREFKVLVQGISDCAIYMLDRDGRVASWNAGAQRLKGYSSTEAMGLELSSFYSEEDRSAGLPRRGIETARQDGKFNAEGWRYRKDGSRFWAHVTIESVFDETGLFRGFAKITRDMTRMREDQLRLEETRSKLDVALSNMHQGLCLFDQNGQLTLANDRVSTLFDVSHEQCPPGTAFEELVRIAVAKRTGGAVAAEALEETLARHRACIENPDGGVLIADFADGSTFSIAHHALPDGGWVSTFDDITDRRRAEQRIEHMALHDELTGLPNRSSYNDSLDLALSQASRNGGKVAVIGIDLDRFKEVNDVHGHSTGDAVLQELARRMLGQLGRGEVVARFGGDEFAAFKSFENDDALDNFISRLERCLVEKIEMDGLSIHPGASLGIAIFPTDGSRREPLVNNADLAMYRAKATIGRQVCFYEQGMDEAARARRTLANDLREAVARDEFSLAYQVQKLVSTEAVVGYEALLRWQHPRDGWISPAEFIPIAEESGEILAIGEWVLRQACRDAANWPEPWRVAVNLSPVQLMHVDLIQIVTSALLESGLPAHRLELEITETALVSDKARALHILRQIKAIGVSIAMDDFGTGYSSLDTLNSFPFDKIKIDRSFLLDSETSHQARAIIRAVLALGHSLEVPVLAEGLETEDQLRLLRTEGCDEAQGYLWGRPTMSPSLEPERAPLKIEAA